MKQKIFNKSICLLLTFIMVLCLFPATTFAKGNNIDVVELTNFVAPEIGNNPSFNLTVPEGANYHLASKAEMDSLKFVNTGDAVNGMYWLHYGEHGNFTNLSPADTFKSNSVYRSEIILVADDGYTFADSPAIKVNGSTVSDSVFYKLGQNALELKSPTFTLDSNVTLTNDPNGGTTGLLFRETILCSVGSLLNLSAPPDEFIKAPEGKTYAGVEIEGVFYPEDGSYIITKPVTVKYIWKDFPSIPDDKVTITYDVNGGTEGVNFVKSIHTDKNDEFRVPDSVPEEFATAPENMEYNGVSIGGHQYKPGETYRVEGDITVKILWKEKEAKEPVNPAEPADPAKPSATAPQTSDKINVLMWMTLAVISMCSAAFVIIRKKKEM